MRLFYGSSDVEANTPKANVLPLEVTLPAESQFRLRIVGESQYQTELEKICGGKCEEGFNQIEPAKLFLEDTNPYDRNPVRVEVSGVKVSYLDMEDAKAYRAYLHNHAFGDLIGICQAQIRGGWKRAKAGKPGKDEGHFGGWLDFPLYG